LFDQYRHGFVVENLAVLHNAVVAHGAVGVEGNVGDHQQLGEGLLDGPHGLGNQPGGVIAFGTGVVFLVFRDKGKEGDRTQPQPHHLLKFLQQQIKGIAIATRHGGYFLPLPSPRHDKHGVNQVIYSQTGFAHHSAQPLGAAQATRTVHQRQSDTCRSLGGGGISRVCRWNR
jgi:hypothetical protein